MRFVKRVNERNKEARCGVAKRSRCDEEMGREREREEKMQVAREVKDMTWKYRRA